MRMCTAFIETAPDVSSSATSVRRQADLRSATSTSTANLFLPKHSRLRPQTAPSASHYPDQYRQSRVSQIPKKCTRTIQVRELSRKSPLQTSHDLAPRNDFTPSRVSAQFSPDKTADEITAETSYKKRGVESSLPRGTTNNWLEPESFNDVVPR